MEDRIVDPSGTDRITRRARFKDFCIAELPFLKGLAYSTVGLDPPDRSFCLMAIRHMLGVSLQFLYRRCKNGSQIIGGEERLMSIVDSTGIRERQQRKSRSRRGYPSIEDLMTFDCGCDNQPCFSDASIAHLDKHLQDFAALAKSQDSRRNENAFLLDVMYHPLSNSVLCFCNQALSALYTVSPALIADVRRVLHRLCNDPTLLGITLREDARKRYRSQNHPANRLPIYVRDQVEQYMDLYLRPDPGASEGKIALRYMIRRSAPKRSFSRQLQAVSERTVDQNLCARAQFSALLRKSLRKRDVELASSTLTTMHARCASSYSTRCLSSTGLESR